MAGDGAVDTLLAAIADPARRAEAETLIKLLGEASGAPAAAWGKMIGFGRYRYRYASGQSGESFLVGFAARASEFSIYLTGEVPEDEQSQREALLARLGKHRMGKGCLYVKRLSDVDIEVLGALVAHSVGIVRRLYPQ